MELQRLSKPLPPETAIGVKDFRTLVEESTVIVDKSLLIKEFLSNKAETQLITYPRRWGKSINMNMIKTFLEIEVDSTGTALALDKKSNTAIFSSGKWVDGQRSALNIWLEPQIVTDYFGQYPVIYITFKGVRGNNYTGIEEKVILEITKLYERHDYLLSSEHLSDHHKDRIRQYISGNVNVAFLENSLKELSEYLCKHFAKPAFILIDEYDTPINHANLKFKNQEEIEKTAELFRGILGNALKENPYLEKSLITGILRIAKSDLFSGINNFQEYGILTEEYSTHYGFTQEEVDRLLLEYNVPPDLAQDIKSWYNGYNFHGTEVYNPWSIIKCLAAFQYRVIHSKKTHEQIKKDILRNYWEESGNVEFISDLLKAKPIKDRISSLIGGEPTYFDLSSQITVHDFSVLRALTTRGSNIEITQQAIDLLFSYLFLAGYLTPLPDDRHFRLPNNEIKQELARKLLVYYKELYNVDPNLFSSATFALQSVLGNKDSSKVGELMADFVTAIEELMKHFPDLERITENTITKNLKEGRQVVHASEDVIHGIMTYIILQVRIASILASEMYLGKGRADLVLIDNGNKKAAIIELKYNKTAREAIGQIKDREYYIALQKKFEVFLIGINIKPDKSVQIEYQIIGL